MKMESTRFGILEVSEEELLQFPHGLPGFQEEKSFAFLPYQPESPFAFLQSVTTPELAFVVIDPFAFFPDYVFKLEDSVVQELALSGENLPQIFTIVRVADKLEEMTTNLIAPIVVNIKTRTARQVVLENTSYTVRHLLFPNGTKPVQETKGGK